MGATTLWSPCVVRVSVHTSQCVCLSCTFTLSQDLKIYSHADPLSLSLCMCPLTLSLFLTHRVPLTLRVPSGGMSGGVFVDIGASDGLLGSNTYLLEKCFGWKGVCIEPRTNQMIKLKMANRTCSTAQVALSDAPGVGQLILAGGLSGLEKHQNNLNAARVQVGVSLLVSVCLSIYNHFLIPHTHPHTHTLTHSLSPLLVVIM